MAIIQHASVSFASNQCNGLSDKEGGVHAPSLKRQASWDCVVILMYLQCVRKIFNDGCSYHE